MTDTDVDALMELVVQGIEVAGVLSSRAPAAVRRATSPPVPRLGFRDI
jgi:hypothetical protein